MTQQNQTRQQSKSKNQEQQKKSQSGLQNESNEPLLASFLALIAQQGAVDVSQLSESAVTAAGAVGNQTMLSVLGQSRDERIKSVSSIMYTQDGIPEFADSSPENQLSFDVEAFGAEIPIFDTGVPETDFGSVESLAHSR